MRILWASNYTSHSGYAHQARLFVPRLIRAGHPVDVLALSGGVNMAQMVGSVKLYPTFNDPLGRDAFDAYIYEGAYHTLVTLIDQWAYADAPMERQPWTPWTPIDHYPVPPDVITALQKARRPIAMSRFGENALKQVGFDPLYVPLAIDLTVWQPGDKAQARRALKWKDDAFIASFVGVNDSVPSRKGIFELLAAWQMFHKSHANALLYLHTSMFGNLSNGGKTAGIHLPGLLKTLDVNPDSMIWVDQAEYKMGIPSSHLVEVARASDVLVAPSRGEGFGLVPVEFQACGCPVITTDFSTQTELNFGGWLVDYEPEWSWQSSVWAKPSILGIVEALEQAYNERGNTTRKQQAIEGARMYDIERVMTVYMLPAMYAITEMVLEAA